MKTYSVINTVSMVGDVLKREFSKVNKDVVVESLLDEHILTLLGNNRVADAKERLKKLIELAKDTKNNRVIVTCSSLGTIVDDEDIIVIDTPMLKKAASYKNIVVVATAKTTIEPTINRISKYGCPEIRTIYVEDAIDYLKAGDKDMHDTLVIDKVSGDLEKNIPDAIVLSQVSLAHLKNQLKEIYEIDILNSIDCLIEDLLEEENFEK